MPDDCSIAKQKDDGKGPFIMTRISRGEKAAGNSRARYRTNDSIEATYSKGNATSHDTRTLKEGPISDKMEMICHLRVRGMFQSLDNNAKCI
jgi:hypothetical protein